MTPPRSIIVIQRQCPGDILMLTAAIRDLHAAHPDMKILVATSDRYLWDNNPCLSEGFRADKVFRLGYKTPAMRKFQGEQHHFIYAFHDSLGEELGITIPRGAPYPDIYLTAVEKEPIISTKKPILLMNAGSKPDFPAKQWPVERFQAVVDALRGRYTVVQIGSANLNARHPKLDGVVDMVDKTPGRRLLSLMWQADAVLTGVSYPMHLCAAINAKSDKQRKCVVLAGQREDVYWEKYPDHVYLTGEIRECCKEHACWRRCIDPSAADKDRCLNIVGNAAACLADISAEQVVEALKNA